MIYAIVLTLFAGLATGIGSLIALVAKSTNRKFLSFSLGLSAGVMIYVSFMEILLTSHKILGESFSGKKGELMATFFFFVGIAISAIIDKMVPQSENPHEFHSHSLEDAKKHPASPKLMRMGIMTALAIGIHNFPEGIATFMAAYQDPKLGMGIAIAIAIHNIPEGIAVSVPIYQATGDKMKAFRLSFLSGLAEPVGAITAYLILMPFLSMELLGVMFAIVAGIMIYISLDELLPAAREWGEHHISILGLVVGMAIMAISLIL
ncbi:MAG: zinc transporter ZupT [Rikenellaceae bacterium]